MEMIFECNEKPVLDEKASVFEKSKMIKTEMPTELRQWLKEQMRAIENKTLDEDKTKKILDMLDEWIYTFHADECSKIIDELKEESKLICANACMKNCNHINAWFECNHTMCIESAKYCGQCIECGKKPTDMRQWLKEMPEKKVVIRVKSTRIKQLELLNKKNKQLETELKEVNERKEVFFEGYKRTLNQLNIERTEKTNLRLDIISMRMRAEKAEDKIEELNKVIDDLKLEISDVEDE